MTIKGIDCVTSITKTVAEALVKSGYGFVCRYLVPSGYPKRLTLNEAKIISEAGMDILCVYETSAGRPKGGAANGQPDGLAAYKAALEIGMPESGCIFFAVDYDANTSDMNAIAAYLRAAKKQIGNYKIGVYGSYSVIEAMAKAGACDCFWQTYAWSYGARSGHTTVYQYKNGQTAAGIPVDFDEAYSGAGMWSYRGTGKEGKNVPEKSTPSSWAKEAADWAAEQGLIQGDENGDRKWQDSLTREQFALVLYRFWKMMK